MLQGRHQSCCTNSVSPSTCVPTRVRVTHPSLARNQRTYKLPYLIDARTGSPACRPGYRRRAYCLTNNPCIARLVLSRMKILCTYKHNPRLARSHHNEPPTEFPLASPYSGIVHHLSGPNIYALPQSCHRRSGLGIGVLHNRGPQLLLSLRAQAFHPNTCVHVRLLGLCFKMGRLKPLCQHPKHINIGKSPNTKKGPC